MNKIANNVWKMVSTIGTSVIALFFLLIVLLGSITLSIFGSQNVLVTVVCTTSIIAALIDLLIIAYKNYIANQYIYNSFEAVNNFVSNQEISDSIKTIYKCINSNCNVFIPPNKCIYDDKIKDILYHNENLKVYIICYGTGFFGNIAERVPEKYKDSMELNILMWDPLTASEKLSLEIPNIDRINIAASAWECYSLQNANKKGKTYLLPTPPGIRACVILNGVGEALWASTQPYYYIENDNKTGRYKAYNVSPAIYYDIKNKEVLNDLKCNLLEAFSHFASKAKVIDEEMSKSIQQKFGE